MEWYIIFVDLKFHSECFAFNVHHWKKTVFRASKVAWSLLSTLSSNWQIDVVIFNTIQTTVKDLGWRHGETFEALKKFTCTLPMVHFKSEQFVCLYYYAMIRQLVYSWINLLRLKDNSFQSVIINVRFKRKTLFDFCIKLIWPWFDFVINLPRSGFTL